MMKSCQEYEPLISAFLDGELSEPERAEVAEHLAACPDCQRYFDDLVAIHDAFDQTEVPVPEGFAEGVMDRVREMPQEKPGKVILFPYWKRWAALAACCALVALGLWRPSAPTRPQEGYQEAGQMARSAAVPDLAADMMPELEAEEDDALVCVTLDEAEKPLPTTAGTSDGSIAMNSAGPEEMGRKRQEEEDLGQTPDAAPAPCVEPAAYYQDSAADKQTLFSGGVTAGGEAARRWVEESLGLEWESGRTYLLTEEEFAGLLETLNLAGEEYALEPGEGCWLLAE